MNETSEMIPTAAVQIDDSPRPASGALTRTGGFLNGFTHTLQPYIGCRFGCDYCYVQGLTVHHFHGGGLAWGAYAHPRTGIAEKLTSELARHRKRGVLDRLAIFMSSTTDPYQGMERRWALTRACLQALIANPPGLLMVQTRSPLVARDFDLLAALGERCWLSFTLETDLDAVRRQVTPRCASVAQRLHTIATARAAGINVQIAVSPCLPFSDIETFGRLLIEHGRRIVVDSYVSGDGKSGRRTARTVIPDMYNEQNWGAWHSETEALALYTWLHKEIGDRAGWSQEGFTTLASAVTGEPG